MTITSINTIIAELQGSVAGAIQDLMPAEHVVARREEEADPSRSRQFDPMNVPRHRLAGDFLVTEDPIRGLPNIDTILAAHHKEDATEALAWYKSYHFGASKRWGVKVFEEGVFWLARCLQDGQPPELSSHFDALDYLQLSFKTLQLHEYFHFVADVACTILELAQRKPLYCGYSLWVYPEQKLEEAVANAYAWRTMRKEGITEALRQFMASQPQPYGQFEQWSRRRAFQLGRQRLMSLMCRSLPDSTGSAAGAELLLRIDQADLDYQDAPLYIESSRIARRVSSPLRIVESIRDLDESPKFKSEESELSMQLLVKLASTVDGLSSSVQRPSLGFRKARGKGAVFTCRVDDAHGISLRHLGHDHWELLRVGRYRDICSNPW